MGEIIPDSEVEEYLEEANIMDNLDRFYGFSSETEFDGLETILRRMEGMDSVKTFAWKVSERADRFLEEENVFILLGEDDGVIRPLAYSDGSVSLVEMGEFWHRYAGIVKKERDGLQGFNPIVDLPPPISDEKYILELENERYTPLRNGGLIGPGLRERHQKYRDDEFDQLWI